MWNTKCSVCRSPAAHGSRVLTCQGCSRSFHGDCIRPAIKNLPSPDHGWRCKSCRVCSDCGSRVPGYSSSARWHLNFTVCDGCYQLRSKGLACPVCGRAYRLTLQRDMSQCNSCRKYVHLTCDSDAEPSVQAVRRESDPEYEYKCTVCKSIPTFPFPKGLISPRGIRGEDSLLDNSQDSWPSTVGDESSLSAVEGEFSDREDAGARGKPLLSPLELLSPGLQSSSGLFSPTGTSSSKKRPLSGSNSKPQGSGGARPALNKKAKLAAAESKKEKKSKPKMRGIFGMPGIGLQRPTHDDQQAEKKPGTGSTTASGTADNPAEDNCLILCSANDKVVLSQDMCVMCGSVGQGQEGRLIACAQCGQAYHPYCINTKVAKVILEKGWRCLDCTFCEGCGQPHDEGKLILCDECDVSYHIYCLDPPLDYVPQGNWKCKWCAVCSECGRNDPGKNANWLENFSLCGPCSSITRCHICSELYVDHDFIIQCCFCDRWSHGICDSISNEDEADKCIEASYRCPKCRPRDEPPPHLRVSTPESKATISPSPPVSPALRDSVSPEVPPLVLHQLGNMTYAARKSGSSQILPTPTPPAHYMDGVTLSESGFSFIRDLIPLEETKKSRGPRKKDASLDLEDLNGNQDADCFGDKDENGDLAEAAKKRKQRSLQRYGVGGFFVKIPKSRKDKEAEQAQELMDLSDEKPKKKRKQRAKSKLLESFPSYMQEAFFGKETLDSAITLKPKSEPQTSTSIKLSEGPVQPLIVAGGNAVARFKLPGEELREMDDKVLDIQEVEPKQEPDSLKLSLDEVALVDEMKHERMERERKNIEVKAKKELERQKYREELAKKRKEKEDRKAKKLQAAREKEERKAAAAKVEMPVQPDEEEHEVVPDSLHDMLLSGDLFNDEIDDSLFEGDIEDAQLDVDDKDEELDEHVMESSAPRQLPVVSNAEELVMEHVAAMVASHSQPPPVANGGTLVVHAKDDLTEMLLKGGFNDDNLPAMDSHDVEALLLGLKKDDHLGISTPPHMNVISPDSLGPLANSPGLPPRQHLISQPQDMLHAVRPIVRPPTMIVLNQESLEPTVVHQQPQVLVQQQQQQSVVYHQQVVRVQQAPQPPVAQSAEFVSSEFLPRQSNPSNVANPNTEDVFVTSATPAPVVQWNHSVSQIPETIAGNLVETPIQNAGFVRSADVQSSPSSVDENGAKVNATTSVPVRADPNVNSRNINNQKWELEEALDWNDRQRQINKIWRALSVDARSEYVKKARENRSASRIVRTTASELSTSPGPPIMSDSSMSSDVSTSSSQTPIMHPGVPPEPSVVVPAQMQSQELFPPSIPTPPADISQEEVVKKQKQLRELLQQSPSQPVSSPVVRGILVGTDNRQSVAFREPLPPSGAAQQPPPSRTPPGVAPMRSPLPGDQPQMRVLLQQPQLHLQQRTGNAIVPGKEGEGAKEDEVSRDGMQEPKVVAKVHAGSLQRSPSAPALNAGSHTGQMPTSLALTGHPMGQRMATSMQQQSASVPSSPTASSSSLLAKQLSHPPLQSQTSQRLHPGSVLLVSPGANPAVRMPSNVGPQMHGAEVNPNDGQMQMQKSGELLGEAPPNQQIVVASHVAQGEGLQPRVRHQVVVQQVAVTGDQARFIQPGQQYILRPQQVIARHGGPGQTQTILQRTVSHPNLPPANIIRPTSAMVPVGASPMKPNMMTDGPPSVIHQPAPVQPHTQPVSTPVARPPPVGANAPIMPPAPAVMFHLTPLPAPQQPPATIDSEENRQKQIEYEQWLHKNQQILSMQLSHYQSEVERFRKVRKTLISRQRQLRKNNMELSEHDAATLEQISADQAGLQKQLEQARKASKQHANTLQASVIDHYFNQIFYDYNSKFRPNVTPTPPQASPQQDMQTQVAQNVKPQQVMQMHQQDTSLHMEMGLDENMQPVPTPQQHQMRMQAPPPHQQLQPQQKLVSGQMISPQSGPIPRPPTPMHSSHMPSPHGVVSPMTPHQQGVSSPHPSLTASPMPSPVPPSPGTYAVASPQPPILSPRPPMPGYMTEEQQQHMAPMYQQQRTPTPQGIMQGGHVGQRMMGMGGQPGGMHHHVQYRHPSQGMVIQGTMSQVQQSFQARQGAMQYRQRHPNDMRHVPTPGGYSHQLSPGPGPQSPFPAPSPSPSLPPPSPSPSLQTPNYRMPSPSQPSPLDSPHQGPPTPGMGGFAHPPPSRTPVPPGGQTVRSPAPSHFPPGQHSPGMRQMAPNYSQVGANSYVAQSPKTPSSTIGSPAMSPSPHLVQQQQQQQQQSQQQQYASVPQHVRHASGNVRSPMTPGQMEATSPHAFQFPQSSPSVQYQLAGPGPSAGQYLP
ncbi:unnamed protein product [Notodromas monacha]|uniref:PHD-type domain-containing protein n=1 Tax=Notodromas monacha TaxID=399045 RepID=A0A7R9GCN1_9CRUS|nr:unnamed protein product [Notodromas monacha]CAG0917826.1 unnamed protein product [Notodromas monacha]